MRTQLLSKQNSGIFLTRNVTPIQAFRGTNTPLGKVLTGSTSFRIQRTSYNNQTQRNLTYGEKTLGTYQRHPLANTTIQQTYGYSKNVNEVGSTSVFPKIKLSKSQNPNKDSILQKKEKLTPEQIKKLVETVSNKLYEKLLDTRKLTQKNIRSIGDINAKNLLGGDKNLKKLKIKLPKHSYNDLLVKLPSIKFSLVVIQKNVG